jgi:hypothetical protein
VKGGIVINGVMCDMNMGRGRRRGHCGTYDVLISIPSTPCFLSRRGLFSRKKGSSSNMGRDEDGSDEEASTVDGHTGKKCDLLCHNLSARLISALTPPSFPPSCRESFLAPPVTPSLLFLLPAVYNCLNYFAR